jgi:uncharacterized DUF497 family protein
LDRDDARDDYGEPRVNSIGDLDGLVIINVTHTNRAGDVRLISARRANQTERELYAAFRRGLVP